MKFVSKGYTLCGKTKSQYVLCRKCIHHPFSPGLRPTPPLSLRAFRGCFEAAIMLVSTWTRLRIFHKTKSFCSKLLKRHLPTRVEIENRHRFPAKQSSTFRSKFRCLHGGKFVPQPISTLAGEMLDRAEGGVLNVQESATSG